MRKLLGLFLLFFCTTYSLTASAILSMSLTQGVAGATPIAVVPFAGASSAPQPVSEIIANDLQNSGRFKVSGASVLKQFPSQPDQVSADYFRSLGTESVVIGSVTAAGSDRYEVNFSLMDMYKGSGKAGVVMTQHYTASGSELRKLAHHISDLVFEQLTGIRGIFSTRIVYVVVQRPNNAPPRYVLEVADQDGYAPRPLLNSPEPIMSPSWSPNGRQVAYVSFEGKRASIYTQEVATGARRLVSSYPGINGAPAWSPDGSRLAIVLSKSGSPNIYVMSVNGGGLTQLTNDFYINTEPAWSPDGRSIIFTSNRSGGPQIFQISSSGGNPTRLTFDGDYNARASFTPDGNHIAFIHRVSGVYKIAILDLDSGTLRVLTDKAGDTASPSIAPNGGMILYDTVYGGRNMLGMVSADGRVQLALPARNGDAQDPSWSPFPA
jgi:TolB protein